MLANGRVGERAAIGRETAIWVAVRHQSGRQARGGTDLWRRGTALVRGGCCQSGKVIGARWRAILRRLATRRDVIGQGEQAAGWCRRCTCRRTRRGGCAAPTSSGGFAVVVVARYGRRRAIYDMRR